jgi:single-strand DNA-binding protein
MINRVVLTGRLTKDIELRTSQTGTQTAKFTIAVDRGYKNQQGQKETDFISCVVFGKTAETMYTYLGKGSLIGIEGKLQTGNFQGDDGKNVRFTNVAVDNFTFLESKSKETYNSPYQTNYKPDPAASNPYGQPAQNTMSPYQQQNQYNQKPTQQNPYSQGKMNFQNGNTSLDDDYSDLPF